MSENDNGVREIRINPIVPDKSVLVATARGMRLKKAEESWRRSAWIPTRSARATRTRRRPVIAAYPAQGDWRIRIVENLYSVLGGERSQANFSFGLQQTIDGPLRGDH